MKKFLIFFFALSISYSQIATYPLTEDLEDTTNSFHGSYNPYSCCDFKHSDGNFYYESSECQAISDEIGFNVCDLTKILNSENFITKNDEKFLKLERFHYFSLPTSLNDSIKENKSLEIKFKIHVPSDGDWGYQTDTEYEYWRTIFSMGDFGQSANGFSINLFKEAEDDRLRIRVFAGGKEKQEDDVAGQIMDAGFIDFDTVVDFSMVINIGSASPGIIFNVDGKRSSHVFDDDSILTGSEGGDIRVKYFKEAIKANQVKVGVDKSLITFYSSGYHGDDPDHKVGGTFYINNLRIYSPKRPGDVNVIKEVLTLFKNHINGTSTLTDSEKADNLTKFLDNWDDNYEPVFNEIKDYIDAYADARDAIFTDYEPINPNTFDEETTIQLELQQSLHDNYFTFENINKDSFVNLKYEDADYWPGPVSSSAPRLNPTITINATYNTDPKYVVNGQNAIYRMTGYYAAPGELITLNVDSSAINSNLIVEIGTSTFPLGSGTRNRFQNVVRNFKITTQEFKIASPFGGPIYFKVPENTNLGNINITLDNVVKMPHFSIKTGNKSDLATYRSDLANNYVKWVDWETDNFKTTITYGMAKNVDDDKGDPTPLLEKWNQTFQVYQDILGRPEKTIREEYIRFDRMNPVGGTWAGASYPMYLYGYDATETDVDDYAHVINYAYDKEKIYAGGNNGYGGDHYILLHEMGHVAGMPTLPDEGESNVNFPAVAVYNQVFGEDIDKSLEYSLQQRFNREESALDWFISPNFRSGKGMHWETRSFNLGKEGFEGNELMYQQRGHAKYAEIAALFGWDGVGKIHKVYYDRGLEGVAVNYWIERDEIIVDASNVLNVNMAPLFNIWGFIPSKSVRDQLNDKPLSNAIKERIEFYRSKVPRNKEEFVTYFNKIDALGKNQDGNKGRWENMAGSGFGDYPEYTAEVANTILYQIDVILCRYYNTNCDTGDNDNDGIMNYLDNCMNTANADQKDHDNDGIGDVCDSTPTAYDVSVEVDKNSSVEFTLNGVDIDNDDLTYVIQDQPSNGTLSELDASNGKYSYNPNTDFEGTDSFTYTVNDEDEFSNKATVTITVGSGSSNSQPVTNDIYSETNEDESVEITLTANDAENDELTFSIIENPSYGTVTLNNDRLTYIPNENYNGEDSLKYNANDGLSNSNTSGVWVTVKSVNDAPVSNDITFSTVLNTEITDSFSASDVDQDVLTFLLKDNPENGTVKIDNNTFIYTPNIKYAGEDVFKYVANDGTVDSNEAKVTITIEDVDLDNDGVLDSQDECPDTPAGAKVDVNGCKIFELPVNNYKVEVSSATCIGTSDGVIDLSVEDASYDYTVTITGKDNVTITGTNKTGSVTGLAKGTYEVCFTVDGQSNYEQCFEVVVGEPPALTAFIDIDNDNKRTSIHMTGSKKYNVTINGLKKKVTGNNFEANLSTGLSIIRVDTDLECQGFVEKEVFISEDIHYYPNPTNNDVKVHVGGEDTRVKVSVFSDKGDLIYTRYQDIADESRKTNINLVNQIPGTYIVIMESKTVRKTFKVIRE